MKTNSLPRDRQEAYIDGLVELAFEEVAKRVETVGSSIHRLRSAERPFFDAAKKSSIYGSFAEEWKVAQGSSENKENNCFAARRYPKDCRRSYRELCWKAWEHVFYTWCVMLSEFQDVDVEDAMDSMYLRMERDLGPAE